MVTLTAVEAALVLAALHRSVPPPDQQHGVLTLAARIAAQIAAGPTQATCPHPECPRTAQDPQEATQ